ncbi:hypothetical protein [Sneathiella chinensis]|uniref:hypothetical protein n=1 Tax=Sneathiella chinensis TaxID=349750 RepID=UPI00146B47F4|nr:hypothetical protein [Sneathiella chinensis]
MTGGLHVFLHFLLFVFILVLLFYWAFCFALLPFPSFNAFPEFSASLAVPTRLLAGTNPVLPQPENKKSDPGSDPKSLFTLNHHLER